MGVVIVMALDLIYEVLHIFLNKGKEKEAKLKSLPNVKSFRNSHFPYGVDSCREFSWIVIFLRNANSHRCFLSIANLYCLLNYFYGSLYIFYSTVFFGWAQQFCTCMTKHIKSSCRHFCSNFGIKKGSTVFILPFYYLWIW